MKRGILVAVGIAAILMLACIVILGTGYRRQSARYAESVQAEEAVRTQFNAALESIAEIQDSLTAIAPEESRLRDLSKNAEMGAHVTQTQKDRMLSTIADLRESMKNTRSRIRELEKNLKGSQAEVAGLKRLIENLKRSVSDKESMIQRLTAKVDSLSVTVTNLKSDVLRGQEKIAEQQQVIEDKRKEIGTIYYIVGTKKDLKNTGIISESGGVLGMGKSVQLSGAFADGYFTPLDTDLGTEISIHGREPLVLSAQNKTSYQLAMVGEGQFRLRILNPGEFRKVKYLVVMVK